MKEFCIIVQKVSVSERGTEVFGHVFAGSLKVGDDLVVVSGSESILTHCRGLVDLSRKSFVSEVSAGADVAVVLPSDMFSFIGQAYQLLGKDVTRHSKVVVSVKADAAQQKELVEKLKSICFGDLMFPAFGKKITGAAKMLGSFDSHCEVLAELISPLGYMQDLQLEYSKAGEAILQGKIIRLL